VSPNPSWPYKLFPQHFSGEKHPRVAILLGNIGEVYRRQGKLDEALKVQKKALKYWRRALGDGHRDVAASISSIALVHLEQLEFDDALAMLEESEGITRRAVGNDHDNVAITCRNIAVCKEKMGDQEGALASAREVHRVCSMLSASHAGQAQQAAAMVQRWGGSV
jgi:tetratricopeptide (TPR) repeat protein